MALCERTEVAVGLPLRRGSFAGGRRFGIGEGSVARASAASHPGMWWQTNEPGFVALNHAMKMIQRISPLGAAGLWLLAGVVAVTGREPSRSLLDLVKLEARVEAVATQVTPATVALISEATGSSGSGVVTTADGLVLTAAHVVQGTADLMVVFPDGKQVPGKVLGANYSKDIAMVQITAKGPWPCVPRGNSKPLEAGDWVIALGHSAGFDPGRTPPLRFGRVISKGPGNFLTTDCTLIGGDSGGPLFDLDGKLVGIHSNIGVALKNNNHAGIDGFCEDWDRLLSGEGWGRLSLNPFANPEMPVLGIEMGLARRVKGVPVEMVVPRSPAAAAGVRPGDLILALDRIEIRNGNELLQVLAKKQPGDVVKLGVLRDDQSLEFKVTLARRDKLFQAQ
ncbi:MAG: serine protease [Verrucomicrobia bacterium]|nr:MAG: serine protease [Verrucomicrobiota bacterium]